MGHSERRTRMGKPDILSKVPLVELAGQNRILIENHCGVLGYSTQEIRVRVSFGCVCITGEKLQLMQMSREQLVICGHIDALQLFRG